MFNGKIDKFTEFDNQISNLNSDKLEHLREIKKLDDEISNKEEVLWSSVFVTLMAKKICF